MEWEETFEGVSLKFSVLWAFANVTVTLVQTFSHIYLWGGVFFNAGFFFPLLCDLLILVSLNDILCLLILQAGRVPSGTQK